MLKGFLNKLLKSWMLYLAIVLTFGTSTTYAQSDPFVGASISLDIIQSATLVGLGFQAGDYQLLGAVGLRGSFGIGLSPSGYFEFAADVLAPFPNNNITPYVGGGAGILTSGGTLFNLHALAGLEFQASSSFGFFAEAAPSFFFAGGANTFGVALKFGGNYHF